MKKVILMGVAVVATTLGLQGKADAAPTLTLHVCQGGTCTDYANGDTPSTVTIGDYRVEVNSSFVEGPGGSNSQTSTVSVTRFQNTSALALDAWLSAVGYVLPVGPGLTLDSTLGATNNFSTVVSAVSYQAYLSVANGSGYPPAGSVTNGLISCVPGAPALSCNVGGNEIAVPNDANPSFSITTRTTFAIPFSDFGTYGSTGQAFVTAVPEPGSMLLLGTGLLGLARAARRRSKAAKTAIA